MNKMQGDEPPYLSVGTAVSAKYKGAFCEAKVSKVVRLVKCKVTYKMGLGTATVSDEYVKGALRAGQLVQIKHPDRKDLVEATITKIQDCSQYTVVFDDGDITTLRRTALCLKSGRHFNESETLDQLPLTHPEHFGNPVVGGRRGRRTRHLKDDSSEGEVEEENEPDLEQYILEVGRVVCIEASDKKRNKDNWFPGLVVMPSAQPTVRINVKDEFLVRSFKDGRYYTVPQKEISEFTRELGTKVDSGVLAEAVEKALKYLDSNELPVHWERSILFSSSHQGNSSDSDENLSESSEDETPEEKDHFVAQLYKFMDDSNTPLNKSPTIASKDVDLHRLFRVVSKLGGYNRVTNKNKWRSVTCRLRLPNNLSVYSQVKQVYRKCLHSYEAFHRTLGVTMHNHPRGIKKSRGRSLIRDKDRSTPVNSPRPDKDEEGTSTTPTPLDKKEEDKPEEKPPERPKAPKKYEFKSRPDDDKARKKDAPEMSDTNSSDATDLSETPSTSSRPRRLDAKQQQPPPPPATTAPPREPKPPPVKPKPPAGDKVKLLVEKFEERAASKSSEDDDRVQQTRAAAASKVLHVKVVKEKETERVVDKVERKIKEEPKSPPKDPIARTSKMPPKREVEERKRGRKRLNPDEKLSSSLSDSSTTDSSSVATTTTTTTPAAAVGDKLKVFYGPANDSKVTYEAKVIDVDRDGTELMYKVHYAGWNSRYDEWIAHARIAENLSAATKAAKRLKQNVSGGGGAKPATTPKGGGKRGRNAGGSGGREATCSRSTTPCSVTSTSSRTKSPATPATRSSRALRLDAQTRTRASSTLPGEQTESEDTDDASGSDVDAMRTRSGGKSEDGEMRPRTYRRRIAKPSFAYKLKREKDVEEEEEEKEEPEKVRRTRKLKTKAEVKEEESDDDGGSPPKGRDFDLNQIRSELKGFAKVKTSTSESGGDKESISSDESSTIECVKIKREPDDDAVGKSGETVGSTSATTSDDIYEFKEPEPFEFEQRPPKNVDDKVKKRLVPRFFEDLEKSPKRKGKDEEVERRGRPRRTPCKKVEVEEVDEDDEEDERVDEARKLSLDPFDELVESPSFHSGKAKMAAVQSDAKSRVVKALVLEDNVDEQRYPVDDVEEEEESSGEPFATAPDQLDAAIDDEKTVEGIEETAPAPTLITKPIFSDDDTNDDMIITPPLSSLDDDKPECDLKPSTSTASMSMDDSDDDDVKLSEIKLGRETAVKSHVEVIETCVEVMPSTTPPPPVVVATKLPESPDVIVETVAAAIKIVDAPPPPLIEDRVDEVQIDVVRTDDSDVAATTIKASTPERAKKPKPELGKPKGKETASPDARKRPKKMIVSREFIDSESDSSDCEERLVIAPSDDDDDDASQTNSSSCEVKAEQQARVESEPSAPLEVCASVDAHAQQQPQQVKAAEVHVEVAKEDDSYLHSLLCEETIPGSPTPCTETTTTERPKETSTTLEMPFASAPGSSNNSNSNGNGGMKRAETVRESKVGKDVQTTRTRTPPTHEPLEVAAHERGREVSTVLDNTPPTTPESTLSNLSPRDDPGGLSPNTVDNDSCKSLEAEVDFHPQQREASTKIATFSEEDTLLNVEPGAATKKPEMVVPSMCRKRRKSCKGSEDAPTKRGRKPLNRSRHNSDSDDVAELAIHATTIGASGNPETRLTRSPKPTSKYNFYVDLDPALDSGQRIAILQQKLLDIRKTYAEVKAELAIVDRRRKKIRRREREAKLAAKQESVAA